ncbi:MAG: M42 family metallopeptidase [Phycisphaerales bacterium]
MSIELLARLCETPGIPGREERVRDLIAAEVKDLFDEIHTDPMGSLICTRRPTATGGASAPRILIAAHMDEIGFYVRHIDDKGFIWVNPAGGFDTRNLFSRRVLVCTNDGDYVGVMNPGGKPVHIASAEDRKKVPDVDEFFIDLGMDADDVKAKIQIGDFVVMHEPFLEQPKKLVSKAIDNRYACYVAIEAVRALADAKTTHAAEIVVAFTVQEEVGLRGAHTAAYAANADYGIGLDVTLAVDTPGVAEHLRVTEHGAGTGIKVQDGSLIADHRLVADLVALAEKHKIPYQKCVLPRGGQDGGAIQRSRGGVRTAAIVAGTRYIHTVTESIDRGDLQASVDLLAAWLPTISE